MSNNTGKVDTETVNRVLQHRDVHTSTVYSKTPAETGTETTAPAETGKSTLLGNSVHSYLFAEQRQHAQQLAERLTTAPAKTQPAQVLDELLALTENVTDYSTSRPRLVLAEMVASALKQLELAEFEPRYSSDSDLLAASQATAQKLNDHLTEHYAKLDAFAVATWHHLAKLTAHLAELYAVPTYAELAGLAEYLAQGCADKANGVHHVGLYDLAETAQQLAERLTEYPTNDLSTMHHVHSRAACLYHRLSSALDFLDLHGGAISQAEYAELVQDANRVLELVQNLAK